MEIQEASVGNSRGAVVRRRRQERSGKCWEHEREGTREECRGTG